MKRADSSVGEGEGVFYIFRGGVEFANSVDELVGKYGRSFSWRCALVGEAQNIIEQEHGCRYGNHDSKGVECNMEPAKEVGDHASDTTK